MSYKLSFRRKHDPYELNNAHPINSWKQYIPIKFEPIKYLEIGVRTGTNIIEVANSYAKHPDSKLYCVDPWTDYEEYPEYKNEQLTNYSIFVDNIKLISHKCVVHRNLSENILPVYPDSFFDIIYIDGNHESPYVYNDGVMALKTLKSGGYIIFDDYYRAWPGVVNDVTKFITEYAQQIRVIAHSELWQLIVQKL